MIRSRVALLKANQILTEHLLRKQAERYRPEANEYSEGDTVLSEDMETTVILTREAAEALNKEETDYFEKRRDKSPFGTPLHREPIGSARLISGEKEPGAYLRDMAAAHPGRPGHALAKRGK